MQKIRIPGTTIETSRLGLGTASLHHIFSASGRLSLLSAAVDAGYTHFDTARMYGEGMAERVLGGFLAGGLRQRVTIATKFGLPALPLYERCPALMYSQRAFGSIAQRLGWSRHAERERLLSPTSAESSLAKSMKALRTDWLDILFVHEPQIGDITELCDLVEWLSRQKSSGRVRYLGLAGNATNCTLVLKQVEDVFDVLQVEDSLAECEADVVKAAGFPLQVTYGYLRRAAEQRSESTPQPDALTVMEAALARNLNGMVLVSTRKAHRLRNLAALAE